MRAILSNIGGPDFERSLRLSFLIDASTSYTKMRVDLHSFPLHSSFQFDKIILKSFFIIASFARSLLWHLLSVLGAYACGIPLDIEFTTHAVLEPGLEEPSHQPTSPTLPTHV